MEEMSNPFVLEWPKWSIDLGRLDSGDCRDGEEDLRTHLNCPELTKELCGQGRPLEFDVGGKVFLKVSPINGIRRFGVRGKLNP